MNYIKLPVKIYGEDFSIPARRIMKEISQETTNKEFIEEKKKLLEHFPDYLTFNFETGIYQDIVSNLKSNVQTGYRFPDCYIKIHGKRSSTAGLFNDIKN